MGWGAVGERGFGVRGLFGIWLVRSVCNRLDGGYEARRPSPSVRELEAELQKDQALTPAEARQALDAFLVRAFGSASEDWFTKG